MVGNSIYRLLYIPVTVHTGYFIYRLLYIPVTVHTGYFKYRLLYVPVTVYTGYCMYRLLNIPVTVYTGYSISRYCIYRLLYVLVTVYTTRFYIPKLFVPPTRAISLTECSSDIQKSPRAVRTAIEHKTVTATADSTGSLVSWNTTP